jgi:hypothetical protein
MSIRFFARQFDELHCITVDRRIVRKWGMMQVSWGKTVLLVGGELNPSSERVEGIVFSNLHPVALLRLETSKFSARLIIHYDTVF